MIDQTSRMQPLPADVATQIKSSTSIPSLCAAVLGLVENSLDAGAGNIDLSIDFGRGSCSVEDDGCGIPPTEFEEAGGLGKAHHTSKIDHQTKSLGGNGTFVSSLAALSILTITSRHHAYLSHNTLILHHTTPAARLLPAPAHHCLKHRKHGTRVTVQDLFGNMPVRVKQRASKLEDRRVREKDWDELRRNIVGLFLAWGDPVSFAMSSAGSLPKVHIRIPGDWLEAARTGPDYTPKSTSFNIALIRSILRQGAGLDHHDMETWVKTSARTPFITVRALISLHPAPSKKVQYISLGVRHLLFRDRCHILYDEVNRTFDSSSFGALDDHGAKENLPAVKLFKQHGFTHRQLKGGGKSVDRWPMFYIRIDLHNSSLNQFQHNGRSCENERTLMSIISVLNTMITSFLTENHFNPRKSRAKKLLYSPIEPSAKQTQIKPGSLSTTDLSRDADIEKGNPEFLSPSHTCKLASNSTNTPPKRKRNSPGLADLDSGTVKLPTFNRTDSAHLRDIFSGWSRIKSGRRNDLPSGIDHFKRDTNNRSSLPTRNAGKGKLAGTVALGVGGAVTEQDEQNNGGLTHCNGGYSLAEKDNPNDGSQELILAPEQSLVSACEVDGEVVDDETLAWRNPVSGSTVMIKARTGLIVTPALSRPVPSSIASRPHMHPVNDCSRQSSGRVGLPRSASEPSLTPKLGMWASEVLTNWQNPIFKNTEAYIPRVSLQGHNDEIDSVFHGRSHQCSNADIEKVFTESSASFSRRLSKSGLKSATIIAQVDKKFILIKMDSHEDNEESTEWPYSKSQLLVLIDQHAADERIRVEALLADLCKPPSLNIASIRSNLGYISVIETTRLATPISFQIRMHEQGIFRRHASHFAQWGILFDLESPRLGPSLLESQEYCKIVVKTLPTGIAERCRVDVKHLVDMVRCEVWSLEENTKSCVANTSKSNHAASNLSASGRISAVDRSWLERIHYCPQGILEMLNSRSCRSAIMFNDRLEHRECETLVKKLAECSFPFQCAHGRPSMIPLVDLGLREGHHYGRGLSLGTAKSFPAYKQEVEFAKAWMNWEKKA